ncbi:MAG TPA: aromatic amino acid lyase [Gaiellales bacterium]|nr:aromatic amino acid lyase [Gaiellales bacterium]
MPIVVTGEDLTLDDLLRVARNGEQVELAPSARDAMAAARRLADDWIARGEPAYGISTGVGVRKDVAARDHDAMLLRQHVTPHPPAAPADVTRAAALRLVNALAGGAAAVRPELVDRFVSALNDDELPRISIGGMIGVGDLSPLAELAVGVLGDMPLASGEMIALINQAAVTVALAATALADARDLLDSLDVVLALDLEALPANRSVLDPLIERARPYPGVRSTLPRLRALLDGGDEPAAALQDPASFRSAPLVHGAARDALDVALDRLAVELNAHQSNPYVDTTAGRIVSVGNWDVQPLATALDLMRIALAPVLTCAGERTLKLLQSSKTGLPAGLAARSGTAESGLGEHAISLQPLVAEARALAAPVSYDLVSTTGAEGIEDRMTLAPLAARRLGEMVILGRRIAAVGLLVSAQACDLRAGTLGRGTAAAHRAVRVAAPRQAEGGPTPDLEPLVSLVGSGDLARLSGR